MQKETTLRNLKNGNMIRIAYVSKDGEKKNLVGRVIKYENTTQGKNALAKNGEIKPSPYAPADGYGDGVVVLKKDTSKKYVSFQKLVRDDKGQFAPAERRTMAIETIETIETI
jgi:hypothetical protein